MIAPMVLPDQRIPVLLSAHDDQLVAADAAAILRFLDSAPTVENVAATLLRTRRIRRHRAVIRAVDRSELADALRAVADGRDHPLVVRSSESSRPRTAFVFPGQGTQWPGMGAHAYAELPVYRATVDRCAAAFLEHGDPTPLPYLTAGDDTQADFSQTETQGAQFSHAVALAEVWRSYGIRPDITIGHSLGEIAATYVAGMTALSDAVAAVSARAHVVSLLPGEYAMAVLGISADDARELIAATAGWVELSAINASSSVVVSGERAAVAAIAEAVEGRGALARRIAVDYPGHTSALAQFADEMRSRLPRTRFAEAPVQFIGSTTGSVVAEDTEFASYWCENLLNTVRFDRAISAAVHSSARAFVEMSGHPSLLYALGDLVGDDTATILGSGHRDEPLTSALSANIAAAAVTDPGYRWVDLVDPDRAPLRDFPNAPMKTTHLWAVTESLPPPPTVTVAAETWVQTPLPGLSVALSKRRIAVFGNGASGPALRAAVARHPSAESVAPQDADMLVVVAPGLDDPDAARAVDDVAASVEAGLLDYADAIGPRCRDVWLVTSGAEQTGHGDAALPGRAAQAAIHRSIGFEHPDQTFRHLDLGPQCGGDTVVDVLLTDAVEVALRQPFGEPTLYRREISEQRDAPRWSLGAGLLDNVVITGGSGAIGLHYARYLAHRGARRIVLLSRRGLDPQRLSELRASGAQIVAPVCDLTDRGQVVAAVEEFAIDSASLLIHAAGAAVFAARDEIDGAALTANAAAKIIGLSHIRELWPMREETRILLCSSVTGVWGGKGVAAYAAANRMLDVVAAQMRAGGAKCVSVRWGLWEGSSIVDADESARVQRAGLRPMPALPAIQASLYDYPVDPIVLSADADRLRMFTDGGKPPDHDAAGDVDAARAVRTELASVLRITDPAGLDLDVSLFDLGVDSLLALDLRKRIKRATGRSVPLAALLSGLTGSELISRLDGTPEKVDLLRD